MSFFNPFQTSLDNDATAPMPYASSAANTASAPESVGVILGKVSIVWAGLFTGIQLSDVVLLATLIYTLLQIGLAVYERIIVPIRRLQHAAQEVKAAAEISTAAAEKLRAEMKQTISQEK